MVIRSLYQPVYHREKRNGLPGAVSAAQAKPKFEDGNKTFEDYLTEAFRGERFKKEPGFLLKSLY